MSWSVDGVEWEYPCTIQRVAEIQASDISGLMLNKTYFNDVIGTYMKYTISIAIPRGHDSDYAVIYELLSNPENYHTFELPYNNERITINARVQTVSDQYVRLGGGNGTWRKISFEIISNIPTKTAEADGIEDHGLTPYPDVPEAQIGDLYEKTVAGWVLRTYGDADDEYY